MSDNQPDAFHYIAEMLRSLDDETRCMPTTSLYNEGWMLRLILQTASEGKLKKKIKKFTKSTKWFSEARLYSPFMGSKGEPNEGFTRIDGIVGDFQWRPGTKTGVMLSKNAKRLEVFEAKMFSKLSKGVKANSEYNQAVRIVACMAQTLAHHGLKPSDEKTLADIGFWVIAPESQINQGKFKVELSPDSMRDKIRKRLDQYDDSKKKDLNSWRTEYFEPLLNKLEIHCESWKNLIEAINDDEERKIALRVFYHQCCLAAKKPSPYADEVT